MSSPIVTITSAAQLSALIASSAVVVIDFHAVWCGPCKTIAPIYEKLAGKLSSPGAIIFTKCDVDQNQELSQSYGITAMPTFLVFKAGEEVSRVQGANVPAITAAIRGLAAEAESINNTGSAASSGGFSAPSASTSSVWHGAPLSKGYTDLTDQIELKELDIMNDNSEFGGVRTLFDVAAPSGASDNKGKGKAGGAGVDWIESDTDEQLMLFIPFKSIVKLFSLQLTSLAPTTPEGEDEDTKTPSRPKLIKIYANTPQILSFDDGENGEATQVVELKPEDWDPKTGTTVIQTRFVKFQAISSLTVFFFEAEKEGAEMIRLDRVRPVGEPGEKREMGKLEKFGDLQGE